MFVSEILRSALASVRLFSWSCAFLLLTFASGCSDSPTDNGPNATSNQPPAFNSSAPQSIKHNTSFAYRIEVSDPDGDAISLSAPVLPFWITFDEVGGELNGQPSWATVGSHSIVLRATDGLESVQQSFQLTVERGEIVCNQPFGDPSKSLYNLPYPVGKTYSINQGYCPSNPAWGHTNWFAYDFQMNIGETVVASRAGQVIGVREDNPDIPSCAGGKENFVFIRHNDGTVMSYVHLRQNGVDVTQGQLVNAGDVLGQSGNSGCSSGPHLHVALFRDGTNYDRQSTLPFNYHNAEGELDGNNGLKYQGSYLAK